MRRSACALAVFLLAMGRTAGQTPTPPPPAGTDLAGEPTVIEDQSTRLRFENDGSGVREDSVRVRIQTDVGLQRYSVLTLGYQASSESVELDYVRVTKPDGSVITTPSENIQDMPNAVTREAPFYSDLREKHVSVKGLGVGDVLESRAVWKSTKPLVPGQFWLAFNTSLDSVVLRSVIRVDVPRERALKWKSARLQPVVTEEGARRIYTWTSSQATPKPPRAKKGSESGEDQSAEDAAAPEDKTDPPEVLMSTFQSWGAVGDWYRSLIKDRSQVTPEIRAKALELTKGAETEEAKARALYNYVSMQVRYIGVAFGIGRYQPHTAGEVLGNQYGDCKDKHTLLAALLSATGIKAYPALINAAQRVDDAVPSPAQFNHMVTAVPHGSGYTWLDTTSEVAPYGYLLSGLRGKKALVVPTDGAAALVTTNAEAPSPWLQAFHIQAALSDAGTLEGTVNCSIQGNDTELLLRAAFRKTPMPQWKDLVQLISYRSNFAGDVSDVRVDSVLNPEEPLRWTYKYTRKDYSDWANRRIGPPLPPISGTAPDEKPTAPIPLGGPGQWHFDSVLTLPAGSKPHLPPKRDLKEPFAEYSASYEFKDGVLKADRRLVIKQAELPLDQFEAYKSFLKAIRDDHETFISLRAARPLSPWAYQDAIWDLPYSDAPEATRAYDDARAAADKNDAKVEIAALTRAVTIDPKFTRAWLWLGDVYKWQRDDKRALDAYRSAVTHSPKEPLAYKVLALNQVIQRQFEDAIATWQKLIEIAPEDPEAFAGLGGTLVAANRSGEAVGPLEKATQLDPSRGDLFVQLGLAQLKAGDETKAVEAFQHALDKDSSPGSLNNAAYALAEAKRRLPLALEYAEKAVRAEEEAAAKSSLGALSLADLGHAVDLGSYWDTLGWVHAQMGHLEQAEKFLSAAWKLLQSAIVGEHLGRVLERRGLRDQAVDTYELALAAAKGTGESRKESQTRLTQALAKLDAPAGRARSGEELTQLRTIKLPKITSETASAEFFLLIDGSSKVLDSKYISGDAALKKSDKALKAAAVPPPSPDGRPVKIVRRGVLSCTSYSGCSIVLYAPDLVRTLN